MIERPADLTSDGAIRVWRVPAEELPSARCEIAQYAKLTETRDPDEDMWVISVPAARAPLDVDDLPGPDLAWVVCHLHLAAGLDGMAQMWDESRYGGPGTWTT